MMYLHLYLGLTVLAACATQLAWSHGKEPPLFSPKVIEEIERLSRLPPLINVTQIVSSIDPTVLAFFFQNSTNSQNSQPNPIASTFPNLTTGTINASYAVLPINYAQARAIVPSQYKIMTESIEKLIPFFPKGKYPLVLSTQIDHDIQGNGIRIPDFTAVQFRFPFIDLLGDGYSTSSYIPNMMVSDNPFAIAGAQPYGEDTVRSTFDPAKEPYAALPGSTDGRIYFNASSTIGGSSAADLQVVYVPQSGSCGELGDYPLTFYANVTNQPYFGCANSSCLLTCGNMIRFFRTNLTQGRFRPIGIMGNVSLAASAESGVSIFPQGGVWRGVKGVNVDTAFIENNYLRCEDLKGFHYLGI
ncbi:MAG: hypothetical protein Q9163_005760 [Psora crenata]